MRGSNVFPNRCDLVNSSRTAPAAGRPKGKMTVRLDTADRCNCLFLALSAHPYDCSCTYRFSIASPAIVCMYHCAGSCSDGHYCNVNSSMATTRCSVVNDAAGGAPGLGLFESSTNRSPAVVVLRCRAILPAFAGRRRRWVLRRNDTVHTCGCLLWLMRS